MTRQDATRETEEPESVRLVRAARADEADQLIDFQLALAAETEWLALDAERVARGVRAVFGDPSRGGYWVAEEAGRIVGMLLTTPEWSDWRAGWVLWIQSVYVIPEARGQGVFRDLYAHQRARVEGDPDLCGLRLYVDRRNRAAAAIYERAGMSREHYEMFEWLKD
ncbi:MAG TPA: GNAT family N-acetyltransferase [Thermoanaerobaculia bacterium]|jgi:GNAT superfamily N-acetyltransferase|nr:GNAT family N-acetyltransferase [Thermoanaerobaculia bacterium]